MQANRRFWRQCLAAVLYLVLFVLGGAPAWADTFTVSNTNDSGPGSLRQAISDANTAGIGPHTINITTTGVITVGSTTGGPLPPIDANVTINGPGTASLVISGNFQERTLFVNSGTVNINNVTLANGNAQGGDGGAGAGGGGLGAGGALFVNQTAHVTIENVQFTNNEAKGGDGGISSTNNAAILHAGGGGGGLGRDGGDGTSSNILGLPANGGMGGVGGNDGFSGSSSAGGGGGGSGGSGGDGGPNAGAGGGGGAGLVPPTGLVGGGGIGGVTGGPADGGNGGPNAGGGGGANTVPTGGSGGHGGHGSGGGGAASSTNVGGSGGDGGFGGGGGGGGSATGIQSGDGGTGGFGGGGGGAGATGANASNNQGTGGTAGFGGGDGGVAGFSGGDGGSAFGGAVFVREGGTLVIRNSSLAGSGVTAGQGGAGGVGPSGAAGLAGGSDFYLMSGVNLNLDVTAGNTATSSGTIAGAGSVTKTGSGTQILQGNNTYTGGTTLIEGTLRLENSNALGTGGLTAFGGILDLADGLNINNPIQLQGNLGINQTGGAAFINSSISELGGSFGITKTGNGILVLTPVSTYTGATNIQAGRLILFGDNQRLSNQTAVTVAAGASFELLGLTETIGSLAGAGNVELLTLSLPSQLIVGGNNTSTTFSGVIGGPGSLQKIGTGTLTLTGVNTYGGTTTITEGRLQVAGANERLPNTTAVTIAAAGTLELLGITETIASLSGSGSVVLTNVGANQALLRTNADGSSTTFFGVISGTGGLEKIGGGVLTLTGANTYVGPTTITEGTLRLTGANERLSNLTAVSVAGGATLELLGITETIGSLSGTGNVELNNLGPNAALLRVGADNTSSIFSGIISGTGGLEKIGPGKLTLTGANTYSGGTTVSAGILEGTTTSLQGNIVNNAKVIFDQTFSGAYTGQMSGIGNVDLVNTGTVTFSGINTYTGLTNVQAGTLNVLGSVAGPVAVQNGARLTGNGSVGATTITGGAAIAPGPQIATLTVNGNFVQQAGSTYEVTVSPTLSDRINVLGSATVGGLVRVTPQPGEYTAGLRYTILTATQGVSGQYDRAVNATPNFFQWSLEHNPNDVQLVLVTVLEPVGFTFNQQAVAANLDAISRDATGDLSFVLDQFQTLSATQARDALEQLSGDLHGTLASLKVQSTSLYLRTVSERMRYRNLLRTEPILITHGRAKPMPDGVIIRGAMPDVEEMHAANVEHPFDLCEGLIPRRKQINGWFRAYGLDARLDSDRNATGTDYTIGGMAAGYDWCADECTMLGLTMGYNHTHTALHLDRGSANVDTLHAGLYGSKIIGPTYALGSVAYGYNDFTTHRTLAFGDLFRRASGNYHGHELGAYVEAGVQFEVCQCRIQPLVGLQYVFLHQNAFTEDDAGAAGLAVGNRQTQSLWASAGVQLYRVFGEKILFIPHIQARYIHEILDDEREIPARFSAANVPFTTLGNTLGRDMAEIGAGLNVFVTPNLGLFVSYDRFFNRRLSSHAGTGGVQLWW